MCERNAISFSRTGRMCERAAMQVDELVDMCERISSSSTGKLAKSWYVRMCANRPFVHFAPLAADLDSGKT
jgi:hypothetical protein